ncbi:unnamed protein product [Rhizoctonia solani]|uniref:Thioredoxin n=1 Tax=Rhizoctonia solani TaxID=456999 RepID=A0A8H3D130_9AGAM|nr:unnamed protein product [Rhizoctonia solani]
MSDKVTHITSQANHDTVIADNKGKLTVIDFHASWCGPCHMIAPVYEKLAAENPDVAFTKVDVDAKYGIRAMPTFKFIKNGEEVDELRGANREGLEAAVAKNKA